MPADHINIQAPERFDIDSMPYRDRLEIEKLKIELRQMRGHYDALRQNLEAIFNRIECGQTAELHFFDGRVFVITGKIRGDK